MGIDTSAIPFVTMPVVWNNGRHDVALGIVPIDWFSPADYNPRVMSDESRERLEKGLEAFGVVDTVIACEDAHLLGGHQRLISEQRRGATHLPVLVVFGLDDAERRQVNVLLNNPNAQGQWDMPALTQLLSELDANGADATLTGFSEEELAKLLGEPGPADDSPGEPEDERYSEQYGVIVVCASEAEQKAAYDRLTADGYNCKVVVT